jgi:hypothetical protein
MEQWHFALAMEAAVQTEIAELARRAPVELHAFLALLTSYQTELHLFLTKAHQLESAANFPPVDLDTLLGTDAVWQDITQSYGQLPAKSTANLTTLWMVLALIDHSQQYYQQASLNAPYPATRLFFNSIAQTKAMLRRRIDGLIRVVSNETWASLGFSPTMLAKD